MGSDATIRKGELEAKREEREVKRERERVGICRH